jgi:two-component system, NtrC family, nitrogen regulation sensor histidine kinase NtrY
MPPSHPRRVILIAVATALPAVVLSLFLLWRGAFSEKTQWTVTLFVLGVFCLGLMALHERVVRPLQTLSNVLSALREGDYSLRARGADARDDSLGLVYLEANALAEMLRGQRLGALEAGALLRTVLEQIDAAIFTFDSDGRLRLVNRGGERLLGQVGERLLGRTAPELGLGDCLVGESPRVVERSGAHAGRFELRRNTFRQNGRPHTLVVLTDVSRTLQAEERQAWQRLIRVLSHEINNSLAPIRSLAGSLRSILDRGEVAPGDGQDLRQGLDIIGQRADSLGRFMAAYARLARLPKPVRGTVPVEAWVRRVVGLERRAEVAVVAGPPCRLEADGDQLDQLLINLLRNAVDAVAETGGGVRVTWRVVSSGVELLVEDDGPGIADTANLFVPFYTTKQGGSGIGLALSRQIAEAHGGTLQLENREDRRGTRARLWIPLRMEK